MQVFLAGCLLMTLLLTLPHDSHNKTNFQLQSLLINVIQHHDPTVSQRTSFTDDEYDKYIGEMAL